MLAALAGKGGGLGALGSLGSDLLGMKNSGDLFVGILHSRTVEDRLVDRFDLRKVYRDRYQVDARNDLAGYTGIFEDRKSGVIAVTVTDRDPRRAALIGQAYVDELDRLVAQVSTSSARRERIFIEERLKVVKQELDNAAQQFSEYASKNGTLDVPAQTKAMVESEATLEGDLVAAQSELHGLEQLYTGDNIRVRTLRARISELKHQVENMSGNKVDLSSTDSEIAGDFPSIRKLPLLGVRWANLYREAKIQETVYELLTQQYELAKIQEAKEIPTVKILDTANIPEKKSSPHRLLLTLLGASLSFGVGAVWIFGTATWKQIDLQDPRKRFAQEVFDQMAKYWGRWSGKSGVFGRGRSRMVAGKK
jgi:capsule polysaccharide export protein KpsE/RkpR